MANEPTGLMTWGEFKSQLQERGLTDDMALDAIDTYSPQTGEKLLLQSMVDPVGNESVLIQTSDHPTAVTRSTAHEVMRLRAILQEVHDNGDVGEMRAMIQAALQ